MRVEHARESIIIFCNHYFGVERFDFEMGWCRNNQHGSWPLANKQMYTALRLNSNKDKDTQSQGVWMVTWWSCYGVTHTYNYNIYTKLEMLRLT